MIYCRCVSLHGKIYILGLDFDLNMAPTSDGTCMLDIVQYPKDYYLKTLETIACGAYAQPTREKQL